MEKKYFTVFSIVFVVILFDQVSKFMINTYLNLNQSLPVINNVFHLTYILNTGAGFGILQEQKWLLIFISLMVIGFILYYLGKIRAKEKTLQILIGIVLGGTIGNLIDRFAYGFVIDFLDFGIWPIFNFADSFLTIGVIGLIIYFWKKG